MRAVAGLSGNAVVGNLGSSLSSALNEAAARPGAPADATFAKGALVSAVAAPGVAPYLAGRVGLPYQFEAGLAYTGRSARMDVRRAFTFGEDDKWAVSLGAGGSAALYGRQQGSPSRAQPVGAPRMGRRRRALVGWESDASLLMVWLGARGGWEHDAIQQVTGEEIPGAPGAALEADRYWGGGVIGAAAGFRHVHVAIELDAQYENITGTYLGIDASVNGVAIVPAGAVWWDF